MKGATMPPTLAATETIPTAEFRMTVGKISALMEEKKQHYKSLSFRGLFYLYHIKISYTEVSIINQLL